MEKFKERLKKLLCVCVADDQDKYVSDNEDLEGKGIHSNSKRHAASKVKVDINDEKKSCSIKCYNGNYDVQILRSHAEILVKMTKATCSKTSPSTYCDGKRNMWYENEQNDNMSSGYHSADLSTQTDDPNLQESFPCKNTEANAHRQRLPSLRNELSNPSPVKYPNISFSSLIEDDKQIQTYEQGDSIMPAEIQKTRSLSELNASSYDSISPTGSTVWLSPSNILTSCSDFQTVDVTQHYPGNLKNDEFQDIRERDVHDLQKTSFSQQLSTRHNLCRSQSSSNCDVMCIMLKSSATTETNYKITRSQSGYVSFCTEQPCENDCSVSLQDLNSRMGNPSTTQSLSSSHLTLGPSWSLDSIHQDSLLISSSLNDLNLNDNNMKRKESKNYRNTDAESCSEFSNHNIGRGIESQNACVLNISSDLDSNLFGESGTTNSAEDQRISAGNDSTVYSRNTDSNDRSYVDSNEQWKNTVRLSCNKSILSLKRETHAESSCQKGDDDSDLWSNCTCDLIKSDEQTLLENKTSETKEQTKWTQRGYLLLLLEAILQLLETSTGGFYLDNLQSALPWKSTKNCMEELEDESMEKLRKEMGIDILQIHLALLETEILQSLRTENSLHSKYLKHVGIEMSNLLKCNDTNTPGKAVQASNWTYSLFCDENVDEKEKRSQGQNKNILHLQALQNSFKFQKSFLCFQRNLKHLLKHLKCIHLTKSKQEHAFDIKETMWIYFLTEMDSQDCVSELHFLLLRFCPWIVFRVNSQHFIDVYSKDLVVYTRPLKEEINKRKLSFRTSSIEQSNTKDENVSLTASNEMEPVLKDEKLSPSKSSKEKMQPHLKGENVSPKASSKDVFKPDVGDINLSFTRSSKEEMKSFSEGENLFPKESLKEEILDSEQEHMTLAESLKEEITPNAKGKSLSHTLSSEEEMESDSEDQKMSCTGSVKMKHETKDKFEKMYESTVLSKRKMKTYFGNKKVSSTAFLKQQCISTSGVENMSLQTSFHSSVSGKETNPCWNHDNSIPRCSVNSLMREPNDERPVKENVVPQVSAKSKTCYRMVLKLKPNRIGNNHANNRFKYEYKLIGSKEIEDMTRIVLRSLERYDPSWRAMSLSLPLLSCEKFEHLSLPEMMYRLNASSKGSKALRMYLRVPSNFRITSIDMTIVPLQQNDDQSQVPTNNVFQGPEGPLSEDHMESEWFRFITFQRYSASAGVSAVKLAKHGFYYTGNGTETKCHFCSHTYSEWDATSDIEAIHLQISPGCPLANGRETNNIPIHTSRGFPLSYVNIFRGRNDEESSRASSSVESTTQRLGEQLLADDTTHQSQSQQSLADDTTPKGQTEQSRADEATLNGQTEQSAASIEDKDSPESLQASGATSECSLNYDGKL